MITTGAGGRPVLRLPLPTNTLRPQTQVLGTVPNPGATPAVGGTTAVRPPTTPVQVRKTFFCVIKDSVYVICNSR